MFDLAERLFRRLGSPATPSPVEPRPAAGPESAHLPGDQPANPLHPDRARGLAALSPDWFAWHLALDGPVGRQRQPPVSRGARGARPGLHASTPGRRWSAARALLSGYAASTPQRAPETLGRDARRVAALAAGA